MDAQQGTALTNAMSESGILGKQAHLNKEKPITTQFSALTSDEQANVMFCKLKVLYLKLQV